MIFSIFPESKVILFKSTWLFSTLLPRELFFLLMEGIPLCKCIPKFSGTWNTSWHKVNYLIQRRNYDVYLWEQQSDLKISLTSLLIFFYFMDGSLD